jgi:DNA polymerase IV
VRSVLFVDPPAFCTTLEGLAVPTLRTRPLAIAPPGIDRATILALSAEARQAGLFSGMPVRTAQRLCPDLILLPPNPQLYARASRALHAILRAFAPTIEPRGYGHAFLDLTGTGRLLGAPQDVAARIRREVNERLGLPLWVGIAANKLVSQAAIKAGRRDGGTLVSEPEQLYVPRGSERAFLAPQPLDVLPELDHRLRLRLYDYQLDLIGEVAAISENALCAVFGRDGRVLRARAQGIDSRPVLSPERQSEFHQVHTLTTETNDIGVLHPLFRLMSERLGRRLRQRRYTAGRLRLEATYADYTTTSRSIPLYAAVLDAELWDATRRVFALANSKRLAVREVALTLDQLMEAETQLELWAGQRGSGADGQQKPTNAESLSGADRPAAPRPCPAALQHAVDRIHARYGARAVLRGSPLTAHCSPLIPHQVTTIFPKVALPSSTRCASAS